MRGKLFVYFTVALFLLAPSVYGGDGPYLSANFGLAATSNSDVTDSTLPGTQMDLSYDAGFALGGALGYHFGHLGIEGEICYQKTDFDDMDIMGANDSPTGDTSVLAILVNGYFTLNLWDLPLIPYITGGLGFAKVNINDFHAPGTVALDWSDDDTVFAYQVGFGADFDLGKKFTIGAKYRFFGTTDPEFATTDMEFTSHNILGVVKYRF